MSRFILICIFILLNINESNIVGVDVNPASETNSYQKFSEKCDKEFEIYKNKNQISRDTLYGKSLFCAADIIENALTEENRQKILSEILDRKEAKNSTTTVMGDVQAFLIYYSKQNNREAVINILSQKCPDKIGLATDIEYFLVDRTKFEDPFFLFVEAFRKSTDVENRKRLADIIRRAFLSNDNDDAYIVEKSAKWYMENKKNLTVNQEYTNNSLVRYAPLFILKSNIKASNVVDGNSAPAASTNIPLTVNAGKSAEIKSKFTVRKKYGQTKQTDVERLCLNGKIKTFIVMRYEVTYSSGNPVKNAQSKYIYKYDDNGSLIETEKCEFRWGKSNKYGYKYKYDDKKNELEALRYNGDGVLSKKDIYKYDDKNHKVEAEKYETDGTLSERYIYKYDDKGNKIEDAAYKGDGGLIWKHIYKYDDNDNELEDAAYKEDGTLRYKNISKYDSNGNRVEYTAYKGDGGITWKHICKYDADGNEVEEVKYKEAGIFDTKSIFKYDGKGNKIEEAMYDSSGHLGWKHIYKYSNKGEMIEDASYAHDGVLRHKSLYKYDDKGNKIEVAGYEAKEEFGQTVEKMTSLSENQYTYYDSSAK